MLRTVHFTWSLPKSEADALNRESGRISPVGRLAELSKNLEGGVGTWQRR
jgi:hypothetical protein